MSLLPDTPDLGLDRRVLLLTPTRRDAEITSRLLLQAGLPCHICETAAVVANEIDRGVGAILLTEEAISDPSLHLLAKALKAQEEWSHIPVVLLSKSPAEIVTHDNPLLGLGNVTLVERPAPIRSIISAVESAVRAREWQYQIRHKMREIAEVGELFTVMANAIPQLAWMADPCGRVFWFNRRWYEYTGTEDGSLNGWTNLVDPEDLPQVQEKWTRSLETGHRFEMEYAVRGGDGSFRTFLALAEPIRDSAGEVVRWLGTYTDIEEQRRFRLSREALLESERFARGEAERATILKDEFLATLSHELRTPLSAILGWSYLIQKSPDNPDIVSDGGQIIARSGEALKSLVEDLLDLSRITSGKFRLDIGDVSLESLVRETAASFIPAAAEKGLDLDIRVETEFKPMKGDTARLQQVVSNLVSNAIRFTPRGGKISVLLAYEEGAAVLKVADTGEGIPSEFLPHLFDRFRQADASTARRHGGMGIGLSLVKQFTELHGGTVEVDSEGAGKGSIFIVKLPFIHPDQFLEQDTNGQSNGELSLKGHSLLIIDDDQGVRDFLSRLLLEDGAEIHVAASVEDALREIEDSVPDLLISDIGMPVRDGYELIRQVRARGYEMPAIALTAFARAQDKEMALAAGFQHHLAKPIEPSRLLHLVHSAINGPTDTSPIEPIKPKKSET